MPSAERFARVGEVELCWQQFGRDEDEPLLLVMGLGAQMLLWPDGLCELLAERAFRVIRFDNRDCGRSTVLEELGAPDIGRALRGELERIPYTLSDMAGDAAGLLDSLGIVRAHLVGASLGGMIAQHLAFERPERVVSLASVMSHSGAPGAGRPTPRGMQALLTRPPADRAGYIEATVRARALIGSPGFPRDEGYARDLAARCFDRGYHPDGTARQVVAIIASGDRTARLHRIGAPTVVIHGEDDELIDASGGRATAAAIPDAQLVLIPGMGHDLPPGVWSTVADAIASNVARAGVPAG